MPTDSCSSSVNVTLYSSSIRTASSAIASDSRSSPAGPSTLSVVTSLTS